MLKPFTKVMLAEAVARYGLERTGLAHRLQRQRELIGTLSEHTKVTSLVQALSIHVESIALATLERATLLSTNFKLLTNDALTIAVIEHLGLKDIATNDHNFASLTGITVWMPA